MNQAGQEFCQVLGNDGGKNSGDAEICWHG
jgi:hypothetical protein